MECPMCGGKMKRGKVPYFHNRKKLGDFEADECTKCKEVFFTEEASDQIDELAGGVKDELVEETLRVAKEAEEKHPNRRMALKELKDLAEGRK